MILGPDCGVIDVDGGGGVAGAVPGAVSVEGGAEPGGAARACPAEPAAIAAAAIAATAAVVTRWWV